MHKWTRAAEAGKNHLLPRSLFSKKKDDIWGSGAARERDVYTFILSWAAFWHELYFQSPSTIGEERQYNPFLRSHSPELHLALGLQQFQDEDWTQFRARVLEELRKRKDLYNRR